MSLRMHGTHGEVVLFGQGSARFRFPFIAPGECKLIQDRKSGKPPHSRLILTSVQIIGN
jgi:hypothetical protein